MKHTPNDYVRCASNGMTVAQAAASLGVAPTTVQKASTNHGIKFAKAKMGRPANRAQDGGLPRMAIARVLGNRTWTTGEIARYIGITDKSALYHLRIMVKMGLVEWVRKSGVNNEWRTKPTASEAK